MLQQQSYGAPSAAVDTSSSHHGSSHHGRPDVNTTELATSGQTTKCRNEMSTEQGIYPGSSPTPMSCAILDTMLNTSCPALNGHRDSNPRD